MPQSEVIGARGLFINPSLYVNMPAGAMSLANNVYIDRDYLLTSRRGFNLSTISSFYDYEVLHFKMQCTFSTLKRIYLVYD